MKKTKLEKRICEAVGASSVKQLSWMLCEATMPDGRVIPIFFDERDSRLFKEEVYSFHESDFVDYIKDRQSENPLIAVVEDAPEGKVCIIDPQDPNSTDFFLIVGWDENGGAIYNYKKMNF